MKEGTPPDPLDLNQLVSLPQEKQSVSLLQWLTECESFLSSSTPEHVFQNQQAVLQALLNLLSLPTPPIGYVLRSCLGRCFSYIFEKGDRRALFDTVSLLLQKIVQLRMDKEPKQQHATISCLGAILGVAGDSIMQLIPEVVASLIRITKTSHSGTGIRAIAFDTLRKTFIKHNRIKDEGIGRDLVKAIKFGLTDKSYIIQVRAAELLDHVSHKWPVVTLLAELESIKALLIQIMDTSSKRVRKSAAQSLASLLVSVLEDIKRPDMVEDGDGRGQKKKKGNVATREENEEGPASPLPGKSPGQSPFRLEFRELLRQLSTAYSRSQNRYIRNSLVLAYAYVLKDLGSAFADAHYSVILEHLLKDVAIHPLIGDDRYRSLEARQHIRYILGHVLRRQLLNEPAKLMAIRAIIKILEKKRDEKGTNADSWPPEATVSAVSELAELVQDLGSAVSLEQEPLQATFKCLMRHTHNAVQAAAAWGLRSFLLAVPAQIESTLSSYKSDLQKHLDLLLSDTGSPHGRIAIGIAQGLAVGVQICSYRPLYFSTESVNEIWALANSLLQSSSKSDIRSSQAQIQISWNLIGALMAVGHQFVKPRIGQLLLLWQNALPRPSSKESMIERNSAELQYLFHVRERALAALCLFLQYNVKLLTHDTSKRLTTMLTDTMVFAGRLPPAPPTDDARLLGSYSQLMEIAVKVKMRVMRCYCILMGQGIRHVASPELLMTAISIFVEPDPIVSKVLLGKQSVIGSFNSSNIIYNNHGPGVLSQTSVPSDSNVVENHAQTRCWIWDSDSDLLDQMLSQPIIGALENDVSQLFSHGGRNIEAPLPVLPATALIDAAIDLFSHMVFEQPPKIQESAFAQIAACISDGSLARNPSRKVSVTKNIVVAIFKALSNSVNRSFRGTGRSDRSRTLMVDVLQICIVDPDASVRFIGCDAMGRLCSSFRDVDMAKQIKILTDSVVSNREPNARAGFAFALGSILYYMGGMAAGLHLRTVLGLLLSLANDPHPTVHLWALEAMERAINSSGLSFSPHISSCLGAITQLILSDHFDPEDVGSTLANASVESPTLASLMRCIDAIINVLGPDLASSRKSRALISMLVNELENDADTMVSTEVMRCMQHLNLFAPDSVDLRRYIHHLESGLASSIPQIRQAACEAIYGLIRRDAKLVFQFASSSLPDNLWSLLNFQGQSSADAEEIIQSWVEQTALSDVKRWIDTCLKLLSHSGQRELLRIDVKGDNIGGEQSEFIDEAAGLSSRAADKIQYEGTPTLYLRWQAISFALFCLRRVVEINLKNLSIDPGDSTHPIVIGVGDLIRAAFTASTSTVVDIRLGGLYLLHDLVKGLAECVDPDFPESTLLEQYQAQIGSALTPAFAADSSPEIAAEAISVCAEFISSDIVKDVLHMGRPLKILVSGLVNIGDDNFIGELKIPNANARLMTKLAVLSAWAELQIKSTRCEYLVDIIAPHIKNLITMWLETLTAYAKLQFEPDGGDGAAVEELMLESQLANNCTHRQIYVPAWLQIINAVAVLVELESENIFEALDIRNVGDGAGTTGKIPPNYRDEPVAFFFVIYGLCFQTLLRAMNNDDREGRRTIEVVLDALNKFLRPSISGNAMYKGFVFAETTDLLDRLILMESPNIQLTVIHIATNLAKYHPNGTASAREVQINGTNSVNDGENVTDGIEQLLDLVHILILALNGNAIWLLDRATQTPSENSLDLTSQALVSLIDTAELFPFLIKCDLYGGIFSVFDKLTDMQTGFPETAQVLLAPFRKFCQNMQYFIRDNPLVAPKVHASVGAMLCKLLDRLENIHESQIGIYEAACFLSTVAFTTIPELFLEEPLRFGRFCAVLAYGLVSPKMSVCAMKCFKALFSSELHTHLRGAHSAIAELVASVFHAQTCSNPNLQAIYNSLSIIITIVEQLSPREVSSIITLLLPALTTLCDLVPHDENGERETAAMVMDLANINPVAFKVVLGQMEVRQRDKLEELLRVAFTRRDIVKEERKEPSISLTMDFTSID